MCGVVGYIGEKSEESRKIFVRICEQSLIRGVHSFGYSYWNGDKIITNKGLYFEEVVNTFPRELPEKIIFHNRYSTSGDYKDFTNNQPLEYDNSTLVFNGVVDMGTKTEMEERHHIKMKSYNDGEIVLQNYLQGNSYACVKNNGTSYAGIILTSGKMSVFRNENRPLWRTKTKQGIFFASTRDIFLRAGLTSEMEEVPPMKEVIYG
jgi:glutamine phosphoribosylpyrophosphate amidotransferase